MERLNLLGVALGLACLAGINLYLTVFAVGLAINQHWIVLSPAYQSLALLGHPVIVSIAGVLYFLEFFADKIPWIDSAWDTVHTIIRPIGGAFLGIQALGHTTPAFDVVVALLAGTTSLMTHTAKATSRLVANASPEPFSNIGLSVGEDVAVLGGLALIYSHPALAFILFVALLGAFVYFLPKIFRALKAKTWLILKKLNGPAGSDPAGGLPPDLPATYAPIFQKQNLLNETIAWAVPCLSARGRGIPPNLFGAILVTNEEPRKLLFIARKSGRGFCRTIDLHGSMVARDPRFLSENLAIFPAAGRGAKYLFVFPRTQAAAVEQIVEYFRKTLTLPVEPAIEPALA